METLICRSCGWYGESSQAHYHEDVSSPGCLLCPVCFEELDEATEEDLEDDDA